MCFVLELGSIRDFAEFILSTFDDTHELKYEIETLLYERTAIHLRMYVYKICNCSRLRLIVPPLDLKYIFMNLSKNRTFSMVFHTIIYYMEMET